MKIDPAIFKAYDIRGIYQQNIDENLAEAVGKAFVKIVDASTVVVGRDARISSPQIHRGLIAGLTSSGADVIDIGMVSTDMYYFACAEKNLPGIMVTASHNPKEYNGFKMVKKIPQLLSGDEGIAEIKKIIEIDDFPPAADSPGRVSTWNVMSEFVEKVLSLIDVSQVKPFRVIADTANGMVGPSLREIFKKIPQCTLEEMYFEPDGNFPNHGGDPLQEANRAELMSRVVTEKFDFGFAFDPDGDRFFCIDDQGRFVSGDFMTAILAKYFLQKNPGDNIVYDIRASHAVPDLIKQAGGQPLYNRVGHSFIKKRMMDENAVFGGEVTGHYYFRDFYFCDSGVAPMLYLLEMISKSDKKLSQILDELGQVYFISGEINTTGVDAQKVFAFLEEKYSAEATEIIKIDGITMEMPKWHFNVRASNTEPLVRLNVEATTEEMMNQKRDELLAIIQSCQS